MSMELEFKSQLLTETAHKIAKDGGFAKALSNYEVTDSLSALGIADTRTISKLTKQSISLSSPDASNQAQGGIGQDTYAISSALIQQMAPEANLKESPLNIMIPTIEVPTITRQQDIMSSNYGLLPASNGVGSQMNKTEMLKGKSSKYNGRLYDVTSNMSGTDLINLRELGSANTQVALGAAQLLNYSMLNLLEQAQNRVEVNRIDVLKKGSVVYKNSVFSAQVPSANVFHVSSESLGTYKKSTNEFIRNASYSVNPLQQIALQVNRIKLTLGNGAKIKGVLLDPIIYQAIFATNAVQGQTSYISAVAKNDVMEGRKQAFQYFNVPALQDVPLMTWDGAIKLQNETTSVKNSRPILWGETVDSASFRALVILEVNGLNRIAELGFFPNMYERVGYSEVVNHSAGGIVLLQQDLAPMNMLNQEIQQLCAVSIGEMVYQPDLVYTIDFNINVIE